MISQLKQVFVIRTLNSLFKIKFQKLLIHLNIFSEIGNILVSSTLHYSGKLVILQVCKIQCFNDEIFESMYNFIQDADMNGETVIIVCLESNVSAMGIILWFLMKRFNWIMKKSLEYIKFKIPELQLKPQFLQLMGKIEKKINATTDLRDFDWDDQNGIDSQEILLKNTYFNSIQTVQNPFQDFSKIKNNTSYKETMLRWKDNFSDDKQKLITLYIPPYSEIQFKQRIQQRQGSLATKKKPTAQEVYSDVNQKQYKFQNQPMFDLKELKTINLYKDTKELQRNKKEIQIANQDKGKVKQKTNFQQTIPIYETKVNNFFNQTLQEKKKTDQLPIMNEGLKTMKKPEIKENLQNLQKNYLKIYSNNNKINITKPVKKKKTTESKRPRTARSEQKEPEQPIYPITGFTLKTCNFFQIEMFNNIKKNRQNSINDHK